MTIIFSPSSSSSSPPSLSSSGKNSSSSSRLLNNSLCCCCIGHSHSASLPHQLGTYQAISAFDKNSNNNPNCSLPRQDCRSGPFNNNNNNNGRISRWKQFLWKLRAQAKKIRICRSLPQQELHYDPLSYAKNFDDGTWIHDAAFFSRFSTPLNPVNQG